MMRTITVTTQTELDAALARADAADLAIVVPPGTAWAGNLDIHNRKLDSLDVRGATITGDLWADGATITGHLRAHGAKIGGDLWADGATIGGDLRAHGATIGGHLRAYDATIGGHLRADGAKIGGDLRAYDATIGGHLRADGAKIGGGNPIAKPTAAEVAILDAIPRDRCEMGTWHGSGEWRARTPETERVCGTTHCLAGWAQALSADAAVRVMDPQNAGVLLLPNCRHLFFAPTEYVRLWLEKRKYA